MPRSSAASAGLRVAASLSALSMLTIAAAAQAPDRWIADEVEAHAALPLPRDNARVTAAAFSCGAQKWTLRLNLNDAPDAGPSKAEMNVDGRIFSVDVAAEASALAVAVPRDALEPLKAGLRLTLDFRDALEEKVGDMTFPLRGSRVAISAVEERCTLRDMSAFQAVTFTPYSSYINLARKLRDRDIDAFALSTASQPKLDVAMVEFGDDRRVLFTRLCGSSWYYGVSGCNITGFAPEEKLDAAEEKSDEQETREDDDAPEWRAVYDSENVFLYSDPKSASEGWRDLVTLAVRGSGPGLVWRWQGDAYVLDRQLED